MGRILQALLLKPWNSMTGSKRVSLGMWEPNRKEDMVLLIELIEAGKVTPVIDRTYPLKETREAMRYVEDGHARGKVVIAV